VDERSAEARLLEGLLERHPDRVIDAGAALAGEGDELRRVRDALALAAFAAAPVTPPGSLRERLLAAKPRPRRPRRPVVLVLDMLQDHLTPGRPLEIPRARDIVPALKRRLEEARAGSVPVLYACDSHSPDDPDFAEWPVHAIEGTPGADVWPDLAPSPGDLIVRKRTYSAFTGSTLGPLLDELGADEIVLTGCATEIGLQATAVDALQRGFVVTIPPDLQAGTSPMGEQLTLIALGTMPPFEPRYLRKRA
jgi:nicotinamidase-related amidase